MRMRILTFLIPLILVLICGAAFSKERKYKKHPEPRFYGEQAVYIQPGPVIRAYRAAPRAMRPPIRFKVRHALVPRVPVFRAAPVGIVHQHLGYPGYHHHPNPHRSPRRGGVRGYIGFNVGIEIGF